MQISLNPKDKTQALDVFKFVRGQLKDSFARDLIDDLLESEEVSDDEPSVLFRALVLDEGFDVTTARSAYLAAEVLKS